MFLKYQKQIPIRKLRFWKFIEISFYDSYMKTMANNS